MGEMEGPHELLGAVAAGVDLFTLGFVTVATEGGIALGFVFPGVGDEWWGEGWDGE